MRQGQKRKIVAQVMDKRLNELKQEAVYKLNEATEGFIRWADRVRDKKAPYRFRWSVKANRDANIASTSYILSAFDKAGVQDRVLTPDQKQQGIEWISSLEVEKNSYEDPALLAYKPPIWDDEAEKWPPTGAHKEAMNQYARGCLRHYVNEKLDNLKNPPPPDWPQLDEADQVLDWIKKVEPNWSWIGRMIKRLMDWHIAGKIPVDPLVDCLKYAYSRQDPETGFWDDAIQKTFKIIITVLEPMGLPVPYSRKIIDSVLSTMYSPGYDDNLFPCEEFDAFYDIAVACVADDYREQEILKWTAYRIAYILDSHIQDDEGISSYSDRCIPTWLSFDMAPEIAQGDAFGLGIYGSGFSICVDLLDVLDETSWQAKWRYKHNNDDSDYVKLGQKVNGIIFK